MGCFTFLQEVGTMKSRLFLALASILFVQSGLVTAGQSPLTIRRSELERMPLTIGKVQVKIIKFKDSVFLSSEMRTVGTALIELQAENLSQEFTHFDPNLLMFVGQDNQQSNIWGINRRNEVYPARERLIAPGARIREAYSLTEKINLPARLYYDDRLLAVIVE
jgi:hypothetical protein